MIRRSRNHGKQKTAPTLRTVADVVGLAPCSVSAILNNSAAALAIPEHTKERVLEAVRQLNYRPNLAARSLRTRRSYMVALVASDLGDARTARIVAGVERFLRAKGYLMVASSWDRSAQTGHASQLLQRGIEGVISIDAILPNSMTLPLVFIDLPATDMPEPIMPLKRERLLAMGEAAAQSLVTQIERRPDISPASPLPRSQPSAWFPLEWESTCREFRRQTASSTKPLDKTKKQRASTRCFSSIALPASACVSINQFACEPRRISSPRTTASAISFRDRLFWRLCRCSARYACSSSMLRSRCRMPFARSSSLRVSSC